jgi:hypothetical protein
MSQTMHPAAKLQFEKVAQEYTLWRSVSERERSPAPVWWWQPAMQAADQSEEMPALICHRLELPAGSTYADGANALKAPILQQTSQPWPDEFPRKISPADG